MIKNRAKLKLYKDHDSCYETNKYIFRRNVDLFKKPFHLNATYKSYYKLNEKEEMEQTFFDYLYFSCFVAYHLDIPDFHYDDFLFVNKLHDSTDFGFRIISQFEKHSKPDFLDLYFFDENGRLTDESKELLSINFKI